MKNFVQDFFKRFIYELIVVKVIVETNELCNLAFLYPWQLCLHTERDKKMSLMPLEKRTSVQLGHTQHSVLQLMPKHQNQQNKHLCFGNKICRFQGYPRV